MCQQNYSDNLTHPEIDIYIASMAKLLISHLKCDRHLVIFMKLFMEAISTMSCKLNIVSNSSSKESAHCQEDRGSWESHIDGRVKEWMNT